MTTRRLDAALVDSGVARSRGHARDLIAEGRVRVGGVTAAKASLPVERDAVIEVDAGRTWVGRAAYKLEAAFDAFGTTHPAPLDATGKTCLDVGASTGGFTQVLLTRGAQQVVALDVGHGQLAELIAADPRVRALEGVNIRDVTPDELGFFDLVVVDLSFISLTLVVPVLCSLLAPEGQGVFLVKPQFEVGRGRLGKNGLVRDESDRRTALARVAAVARENGLFPRAFVASPIVGTSGNVEYLMWVTRHLDRALDDDEAALASAVSEGHR